MPVIDVSKVDTTPGNDVVCLFSHPLKGGRGTLRLTLSLCGLGIVI